MNNETPYCSVAEEIRGHLVGGETLQRMSCSAPPEWIDLLLAKRQFVCVPNAGGKTPTQPRVLFPGSFNPLHRAHVRMAEIAAERLGQPVWFEISITNVDKPPLDFLTIRERLDQLADYHVCLTRAPTFVDKAELFPGATFIVGADTMTRVAEERYYHGSKGDRDAALARLEQAAVRFLVFGRTVGERFRALADLALPGKLAVLCDEVTESEFREDVASTQIRSKSSHV